MYDCAVPTQTGFDASIATTIATEVRRIRKDREQSTRVLADECAKLGMASLTRNRISDLEVGRLHSVTVAELLVLAAALGVPPVLLLCPVGHQEAIEILPGKEAATFAAAQWISGEAPLAELGEEDYIASIASDWNHATGNPLAIYRKYDSAAKEEMDALRRARQMDEQAAAGYLDDEQRKALAMAAAAMRDGAERSRGARENVRREAERLGLLPPGEAGAGGH